ncbi:MAG: hypothetical protein IKH11_06790, partial [Bacteroidales bacterium]|nr:hypothetical protein [Bacteroidales bacterium]
YQFGSHNTVQAIRHVVSPSVSMSFTPELGTYANGYRTLNYQDINTGEQKTYEYNIYQGNIYGPPGKGRSASANISIGNNLEAKVRDSADTTGKGTKKVKLIDQLNLSTSYNFLADSLKMSNINLSMSTSLFNQVSLSGSASFSPYAIGPDARPINKFAITQGQGLARLNNISASASWSISGKGEINGNDGSKGESSIGGSVINGAASYYQRYFYHPVTGEFIPGGWLYYTNPNAPWSLSLSYSFSYNVRYSKENDVVKPASSITQTVQANGNIKLTPRLSITASSGFDLQAMKITTTQFSFTYDLHCFNISVSWVPTGSWASYQFRIAANASALADILQLRKSSSYWDNR